MFYKLYYLSSWRGTKPSHTLLEMVTEPVEALLQSCLFRNDELYEYYI